MTKHDLIEGYFAAQANKTGHWFQRWSTKVDVNGLAYMRNEILDPRDRDKTATKIVYERYEPLDGLLDHVGTLRQLRRWEWYAVRYEWCDGMDLYRFTPGDDPNAEHINTMPDQPTNLLRCFCEFRTLFKDGGGFILRESERIAKEAEARDVHQSSLYQPH